MKKLFTVILISLLFLTACQKFDTTEESNSDVNIPTKETVISDMSGLTISDTFDWKMIKTLDVDITIPMEGNHQITKIMSLDRNTTYFNGYPEDNSNVLKSKITIPTYVTHVLLEYGNGADGIVVSVEGETRLIKATLGNTLKSTNFTSLKATEPTLTCDVTVTQNVTNLDINAGNVYCIESGTTITVAKVRFKGGTLHVKGKLIVSNQITAIGTNKGLLYISSTGEVDANKILFNKLSVFNNFGLVNITTGASTIATDLVFENYGTMNTIKIINQSEDFLNEGVLNVDGQFNNNAVAVNKGTINVTGPNGHFNNTGNPDVAFTNFCKIYVEQNFNQNSKFYHYGYLEVDKKTSITGSGNTSMVMGKFSLIVTEDLQITGEVVGPNELGAKFKVDDDTKLTGGSSISGYIQICDDDGNIEVDNGTKGPNVEFACDWTIPENDCNPGDNPPVNPPDPPDPETFAGTLAFEDLWPGKGDYDINDLVISYDFEITKNAQEKVKQVEATFVISAFGANLHNGFGFSFPGVSPNDISSVTGYDLASGAIYNLAANGTELGQTAATFIVFDDPFRLMPHPGAGIGVNTDYPAPFVTPVTIVLEIDFVDGEVSYSQLDIGNFNPFIVISQVRGMEVHLPDYPPTDLHDPSYFGTFEDDTNPPSKYYMTENNLPWAINIPAQYDYPVERQIILGAYYHFAEWAESSGATFTDWYKDLPGYRNTSVIY